MSNLPPSNSPGNGSNRQQQYHQRNESSKPRIASTSPHDASDQGVLLTRLRTQVEFYFSDQNLSRDTYLRNMLTAKHREVPSQLMAPVGVIINFPKVRDICSSFGSSTSDPPHVLLSRSCKGSTVVVMSSDCAWIGPLSQQLPPLSASNPRSGPPQHQTHQQGPYPPSPHRARMMMMLPVNPIGDIPSAYPGSHAIHVQNIPGSQGTESLSSNSAESGPSQTKEPLVSVADMPVECNAIQLMAAFTTGTVRPKSVSFDENSNIWHVSFLSKADAQAAILASNEKTIAGAPIKAKLKVEPLSAKASVASVSGASLSSMSEGQRQYNMTNVPALGPPMVQQPAHLHGTASMPYPHAAYTMTQPSPPPVIQHGVSPYPLNPHYNMAPPLTGMSGPPFLPYYNPQQMQPIFPYYLPQHGQPYPMNPSQLGSRYGPTPPPPPPPPRYPGPQYLYQPGLPQPHRDGYNYHMNPTWQQPVERRGSVGHFNDRDDKKPDHGGRKKKNKFQRKDSVGSDHEGATSQQFGQHSQSEKSASPDHFIHGKGRGRHTDVVRRSTGSSPTINRNQRNSHGLSKSVSGGDGNTGQHDEKVIFTAADFPGLGGQTGHSAKSGDLGHKGEVTKLSGYADALLKKDSKLKSTEADMESNMAKEHEKSETDVSTENVETEIISEFHDLRFVGDARESNSSFNQVGGDSVAVNDTLTQPKSFDHLPILPGISDIGQSYSVDLDLKPSVDEVGTKESSSNRHFTEPPNNNGDPSPASTPAVNKGPTVAWSSKRLFSDIIKEKEQSS